MSSPDSGARRAATLAVSCAALFLIFLDSTVVNVALPALQHDLSAAAGLLQWAVNGYLVAFAGLVLLGGRLGDRFGHRRVFAFGLLIFGAASAVTALANTFAVLVAGRVGQGVGAALLAPLSLALLARAFPTEKLAAAVGIWAGVSGVGLAIGPLVGGLLVEHVGWPAVFWLNVPLASLALLVTVKWVPATRVDASTALDVPGAALVTVALTSLAAGLAWSAEHAWTDVVTLTLLALGLALLAGFAAQQRVSRTPWIPARWLRDPAVRAAVGILALASFALMGAVWFTTLYLQNVLGYSAAQAGLRTLPLTGTTLVVAPIAGKLHARRGARGLMTAGLGLTAAGTVALARLTVTSGYNTLAVGLTLLGVGLALVLPTTVGLVIVRTDDDRTGVAAGLITTSRSFGSALGLATLAALGARVAGDEMSASVASRAVSDLAAGGQVGTVARVAGAAAADAARAAFMHGFAAAMWGATACVGVAAALALIAMAAPSARRGGAGPTLAHPASSTVPNEAAGVRSP